MCAAALWCVQCRTDLRPQATGRRLLYTPGTSLKLAAEEALLPFTTIDCRRLNESVLSCNARRGSLPLTQPLQLTVCPAPTACFFAVHLSFFSPHVFQSITVASQTLQFSRLSEEPAIQTGRPQSSHAFPVTISLDLHSIMSGYSSPMGQCPFIEVNLLQGF